MAGLPPIVKPVSPFGASAHSPGLGGGGDGDGGELIGGEGGYWAETKPQIVKPPLKTEESANHSNVSPAAMGT